MKTLFEKMRDNRAQLADRYAAKMMRETRQAIYKIQQECEDENRRAHLESDRQWGGFSLSAAYLGDAGGPV